MVVLCVFFQLGQVASACDPTTLEAEAQVEDTRRVSTKIASLLQFTGTAFALSLRGAAAGCTHHTSTLRFREFFCCVS